MNQKLSNAETVEFAHKLCDAGFKTKIYFSSERKPKLVIRGTYGLYKHVVRFAPIRTRHGIRNIENI